MTVQPDLPAAQDPEPTSPTEPFEDFICAVLDEKRASEIVRLDISDITNIADVFIIATIQNQRQGAAILGTCEKERKRRGLGRVGIEGESGSSWILLDYGDLIVHLLMPEQRAYYALENIWADAKRVDVRVSS